MTTGQHDRAEQAIRRNARPHRPQTLAAHRVFAPSLGIWGAALAGMVVMVLPSSLFAQATQGTGLSLLGQMAQPLIAGLGGLVLGGSLFIIATAINRKARRRAGRPSIAAMAARRVHTIDPQRDLGSASLDEPVRSMPFAKAALKHHAEATRTAVTPTALAPDPARTPEPAFVAEPAQVAPLADMPPPRALDLAEFATLPGRDGVWVEDFPGSLEAAAAVEAQSQPQRNSQPLRLAPEPEHSAPATGPASSGTALDLLRAVPTNELSIVQMVERFAAALHDHREAAPGTAATARDIAAREAALAQALRALAALSPELASDHTSQHASQPAAGEPLRDALTQLHAMRGAA